MKNLFIFSLLSIISLALGAQEFKGEIQFSESDRLRHAQGITVLITVAADCLKKDLDHHQSFYRTHGFSPYYGDRSKFAKLSKDQRQRELRRLGKNPALVEVMEPTSCVGLALKCLNEGFAAAGQSDLWKPIAAYTRLNNQYGNALQLALQELGWTISYWNPAPEMNETWDAQEQRRNRRNTDRFWGYHAYRFLTVNRHNRYYYNRVDDKDWLVGFGRDVPQSFKDIPFFIGTAHTGYHVFPGAYGQVIEGHSTRAITDAQTIESSEFNPLAPGGGPRGQYKTGLVAIPPLELGEVQ